jgi:hypothetical protein
VRHAGLLYDPARVNHPGHMRGMAGLEIGDLA